MPILSRAAANAKQKNGVFTLEDRVGDLAKSIKALASKRVMVGIPAEAALRTPEPGEKGTPASNALIGYLMENGVPEKNIPARPFLKPGIIAAKQDIAAALSKAGKAAFDGKPDEMDRQLNIAGIKAQNSVKQKITDGPFQPLAPRTLAARRARGRTGTKPLIDTGALRNAITYVIRNK